MTFTPTAWVQAIVVAPLLAIVDKRLGEFKDEIKAEVIQELGELRTEAVDRLEDKFDELAPKLTEAVVGTIGHSIASFIPGDVDDKVIGGVVDRANDFVRGLFPGRS